MFQAIIHWLLATIAFMIVVNAMPGFSVEQGPWGAMIAAAIIGIANAGLGATFRYITDPVIYIIFSLFILFANGVMIMLAAHFIPTVYVDGTDSAFWGAAVLAALAVVIRMAGKSKEIS